MEGRGRFAMEAWRLKMEPWRVYRPVVKVPITFMRIRIRIEVKIWIRICIKMMRIRNPAIQHGTEIMLNRYRTPVLEYPLRGEILAD